MSIRSKIGKHKKLDEGELIFYKENRDMIDLEEGLSEKDNVAQILRGKNKGVR